MKQMVIAVLSAFLLLALRLPAGPVALAGEYSCEVALGAVVVDNLRVPANANCTLAATQVHGTIVVEKGASLRRVMSRLRATFRPTVRPTSP